MPRRPAADLALLERFSGDTKLARSLLARLNSLVTGPVNLMEVCGTHTMAISSSGVRRSVDPRLRLTSGPGCPVCVTAQEDLDTAIRMAGLPGVTVTTFGDMMRVPGTEASLEQAAAQGHDIRIIYSPLEAVQLAQDNPSRTIVFLGVGFETTAPTIAAAVKMARMNRVKNFFVHSLFKTMPQALRAIASAKQLRIDGFILPGHVSTIIGSRPYEFLAREFRKPCCIVGFELLDLLQGIEMLLEQIGPGTGDRGPARVRIQYTRSVTPEGNRSAQKLIAEVFQPCDAVWRGLGSIPGSGLGFAPDYRAFDARERLPVKTQPAKPIKGCRCGDVLLGLIVPFDCRLFARVCTPEKPLGPCMVSSEGACAAYYKYER